MASRGRSEEVVFSARDSNTRTLRHIPQSLGVRESDERRKRVLKMSHPKP